MRERRQRLEDEGGVPSRRRGARGRRADVEPDVEHQLEQQEYMDLRQEQSDVDLQHAEEQELEEELQAMDEEDAEPRQRRKKNEKTVPVAHTRLACCGSTMCTWPGRRVMARYLLMLNSF
jgi:hypothetical protein